jgi:hypothetical protein
LAVASVEKAWEAFYETTKVESEKELSEQGWKSIRAISDESKTTIASTGCRAELAVRKGILEVKKTMIQTNQGVRSVNLYRPILK